MLRCASSKTLWLQCLDISKKTYLCDSNILPTEKHMEQRYTEIKQALNQGCVDEALKLADTAISVCPNDAMLHYLRGSVFMKMGNWQMAMNNLIRSEQLDANGPAKEARRMLTDIMDFYYKDMYNP